MRVFQFSAPKKVRKFLKMKNIDLRLLSSAFTCVYNVHRIRRSCKTRKFKIRLALDKNDDGWGAYWFHNHSISLGKALLEKANMRSFVKHLMIVVMHEMEHWNQHNVRRISVKKMSAGKKSSATESQAYRAEKYAKNLFKVYRILST